MPIVAKIFNKMDDYKIQVIALWVPHEENTLTDFLSHFAILLDRDSIAGHQDPELNGAPPSHSKQN
jgi:hypothetical protein